MPVYEYNFTDVQPAQGGGQSDHVPPGLYALVIRDFEDGQSSTSKRMVTVRFEIGAAAGGDRTYVGKKITDMFVIDSQQAFGLRRLKAFFMAIGGAVGNGVIPVNSEKLAGLQVYAELRDDEIPANGQYAARLASKVDVYYARDGSRPDKPDEKMGQRGVTAPAPVAAVAPPPPPVQPSAPPPAPVAAPAMVDAFAQPSAAPQAPAAAGLFAPGMVVGAGPAPVEAAAPVAQSAEPVTVANVNDLFR